MALGLQGLGKELYPKTTLELGAEKEIADAYAKAFALSVLNDVKVEEREGFLRRKKVEVENYEDIVERLESYARQYSQAITPFQLYNALKDLEKEAEGELKEKIRALRKEVDRREGISRKKAVGAALAAIMLGTTASALYYQFVFKPEQEKKPYKQAGLTDEEANNFINKYPNQNGNSTWVSFAKYWAKNSSLADLAFQNFKDLNKTLSYLSFSNNQQFLAKALNELGSSSYDFVKCVKDGKLNEDLALQMFDSNFFKDLARRDLEIAKSVVKVASLNSSSIPKNLAYQVLDQIERDNRVEDKLNVARNAFSLLNELNIHDLKNKGSVYIPGNYSLALAQGLPKHSGSEIKRLFNASENCSDIVDFEPIIIKDVTGQTIKIESKNLARDYWLIAELLKNRPEIASQHEKFEWINRMVQQIAWNIFEDRYGPSFYDEKGYRPDDGEVWKVILGFHDYMDSLPSKLQRDNIPIAFPYWDSELLRQAIGDKANRTIALFYLANLPAMSVDKAKSAELDRLIEEGKISSKDYWKLFEEKVVVKGIEGMKKFIEQMPGEYEEIANGFKDANQKENALMWFTGWLADRGNHGLANTVSQFIGVKYPEGIQPPTMDEMKRIIEDTNVHGITQALKKYWNPWDFIKFIYGYESLVCGRWGGEWGMYTHGLTTAYKAFGIPFIWIGMNHDPYLVNQGAPAGEWAVPIPDAILTQLKSAFSSQRIVNSYGNGIGLMSCIDGLVKDSNGVEWLGIAIREHNTVPDIVYLWKK
ncbi:MAG: hypothetical protein FGF52_03875 [Candidatus Brockarchaeota archaeon]|nr:hypothetical protein [Candidatus Brockarchaeota archaeon]